MRRSRLGISAVAVVAAVSIAACSSSTKNAAETSSSGPADIKVGVACTCSGTFGASIGVGWKTLQAWAKTVNAQGGLGGHQVDLVMKDNKSDPSQALGNVKALLADKVSMLVDMDVLDQAWEKAADEAKVPVVGGNIGSQLFSTDPDFYPAGQTEDSVIYSAFVVAKQSGATKIGIVYCAEAPTCAQGVPAQKKYGAQLGVPVAYAAAISATAPNFTAQCLAAKQAGANAIFLSDSTAVNIRVAADCDKQGYHPIYVTEGTGYADETLTAPGLKDNFWMSFPVLPIFSTEAPVAAMNAAVDKYFPGIRKDKVNFSEFAAEAWAAGLLLQTAAKNAAFSGSTPVTSQLWIKGLDMVSGDALGGFAPALTFKPGQTHSQTCWYTAHIHNGTPTLVGGQTCGTPKSS